MSGITRYDVNEDRAHSGIIRAGDFCYLGYCCGNNRILLVDGVAYCGN